MARPPEWRSKLATALCASAIAEHVQQTAQLDNDRITELAKDLRDTQAKLLEVIPKRLHAKSYYNEKPFLGLPSPNVLILSDYI